MVQRLQYGRGELILFSKLHVHELQVRLTTHDAGGLTSRVGILSFEYIHI